MPEYMTLTFNTTSIFKMNLMNKVILTSLLVTFTAACGSGDKPVKTVSEWIDNPEGLSEHTKWCADSVERRLTPSCMNAVDAEAKIKMASMMENTMNTGTIPIK
jgi:hypothetical protein